MILEEQNRSLYSLLAQAPVWAVERKNSVDLWTGLFRQAFTRLVKLQGPFEALSTLSHDRRGEFKITGPINGVNPPLFDSKNSISRVSVEIGNTGMSAFSFRTSWGVDYGKTYTVRETAKERLGRIIAKRQAIPENAKTLVEMR